MTGTAINKAGAGTKCIFIFSSMNSEAEAKKGRKISLLARKMQHKWHFEVVSFHQRFNIQAKWLVVSFLT